MRVEGRGEVNRRGKRREGREKGGKREGREERREGREKRGERGDMRRGGKSVYGRNEDLLVQLCVTCMYS